MNLVRLYRDLLEKLREEVAVTAGVGRGACDSERSGVRDPSTSDERMASVG